MWFCFAISKEWILSIKVDPDYMPRDKAIAFFDEANERIEFIGNVRNNLGFPDSSIREIAVSVCRLTTRATPLATSGSLPTTPAPRPS